ncbi:hypothetical protein M0R04_06440 [Candidatus Dojkabacteria bacterium]|jgi:hypothetical protein|nr:hypothetical protein [Candidatus Dojkabacteria bacterium]
MNEAIKLVYGRTVDELINPQSYQPLPKCAPDCPMTPIHWNINDFWSLVPLILSLLLILVWYMFATLRKD